MPDAQPPFTKLQLVERVDSWPYFTKDPEAYRRHMLDYHYFLIEGYDRPFGYVHSHFISEVSWPEYWKIDAEKRFLTLTTGTDFDTRSRLVYETLRKNHESQSVPALRYWAKEEFPVYDTLTGELVLNMDGCGTDMFGIVSFSVHMTGWVMTAEGIKIWVPRRAKEKMSFPGMLDNTVGGSLAAGEKPIDGIVRECEEEICLDPEYTRANIRACGTNSFQLTVTDLLEPACQHQVQYLYEIELRQDVVPKIGDGEVGELNLLSLEEVVEAMRQGEFKLTCNMTYLAFFIRHGYITAENEPDFVQICSRLNRYHDLFIA
ncbi:NUDIX hydrolase domain-like protein [Bombardia bombarda]|uniref:NUDIX hydrolase domain-like protein n=1 Tax=Bombardia bombarda TaxID=252184 RepID=A0AA40C470_9PEZI|nr:NUDIX hydrolase domain-like protein [Bombardia bombarda]